MHLSRVLINPQRRGARKLMGSPQAMHAAVMSAFPPDTESSTDGGRVLWRLDSTGEETALYVVSPEVPCFVHIGEQAGWSTTNTWATRDYAPVLDALAAGQRYAFRLVGNPTHRGAGPDGQKRVFGHVTVDQQLAWLLGKAAANGFTIPTTDFLDMDNEIGATVPQVAVSDRRNLRFRRGSGSVTLTTARFDGVLEVADPEALRAALTQGIGRAKGYGCGLLTLAPVG